MARTLAAIAALLLCLAPVRAEAHGHGGSGYSSSGSHSYLSHSSSGGSLRSRANHSGRSHLSGSNHHTYSSRHKASNVHRASHGSAKRDPEQREKFMRAHPCPSTGKTSGACPGYIVDHVVPLKRGGADRPDNMQWQTVKAAKAKNKWE